MDWDVFISHASEDKMDFVKGLADRLQYYKVKVWYDEFTLKIGDSLSKNIDKGLANSRYGIVVLSKSFLNKGWTDYELRGLISREIGVDKVILPIWHKVDRKDILQYSPTLADKYALNTKDFSLEEIGLKILEVIKPEVYENHMRFLYEQELRIRMPMVRVNLSNLNFSTKSLRHETLPKSFISRISIIHNIFQEVIDISFEDTINNFKRDSNPEREIIIWESIGASFLEYISKKDCPFEIKQEVFNILLILTLEGVSDMNFKLTNLNTKDLEEIISIYNKYKSIKDTSITLKE